MLSLTREFRFSSAHRIEDHPKCGRMHGHNYLLHVTIEPKPGTDALAGDGMLMDFAELDAVVHPLIDELDHRYLVSDSNVARGCTYFAVAPANDVARLKGVPFSTVECLAGFIAQEIAMLIGFVPFTAVRLKSVTLWENDKSFAHYEMDHNE